MLKQQTFGVATASASPATASITPTANALQVLFITVYDNAARTLNIPDPTVTGCSITWTQQTKSDYDASGTDRSTLFLYTAIGASPTSGAVTMAFGETEAQIAWHVYEVRWVTNPAAPVTQAGHFETASGATSGTVTFGSALGSASMTLLGIGIQIGTGGVLVVTPESYANVAMPITTQANQGLSVAYSSGMPDSTPSASWTCTTSLFRSGLCAIEVPCTEADTSFSSVSFPKPLLRRQ